MLASASQAGSRARRSLCAWPGGREGGREATFGLATSALAAPHARSGVLETTSTRYPAEDPINWSRILESMVCNPRCAVRNPAPAGLQTITPRVQCTKSRFRPQTIESSAGYLGNVVFISGASCSVKARSQRFCGTEEYLSGPFLVTE
jgi:hypothetical protein